MTTEQGVKLITLLTRWLTSKEKFAFSFIFRNDGDVVFCQRKEAESIRKWTTCGLINPHRGNNVRYFI